MEKIRNSGNGVLSLYFTALLISFLRQAFREYFWSIICPKSVPTNPNLQQLFICSSINKPQTLCKKISTKNKVKLDQSVICHVEKLKRPLLPRFTFFCIKKCDSLVSRVFAKNCINTKSFETWIDSSSTLTKHHFYKSFQGINTILQINMHKYCHFLYKQNKCKHQTIEIQKKMKFWKTYAPAATKFKKAFFSIKV